MGSLDLTDSPMGGERTRVESPAIEEPARPGGRGCAICSIQLVSCSARYSWSLVPLPSHPHGSAIIYPQSTRLATTRSRGSISDHFRHGLSWCPIWQSQVWLQICRKRHLLASEKAYKGTSIVRFLWR